MAIHELATNAIKYGALPCPQSRVEIAWRIEPDGVGEQEFVLDWSEFGGPAVRPPERRVFGTTVIERGLALELSGSARLEFATEAIRAGLLAPLSAMRFGYAPAPAS